ncbi:MAG TPA: YfiR family protein [Steroidobacteraceae bacterium]|nr:YfiR family protein [Steroidobacteraceae bacterium]
MRLVAIASLLRSIVRSLLLAALLATPAQSLAAPSEYQVKAVFLFNFSRFIEWPASTFSDAQSPFVVGVFGHDPFGTDLDKVVKGETVKGHPLVVRRIRNAAEAAECQIVFIHQSEIRKLDELLSALKEQSTLTVSDLPGAAQRGVMIRLVTEGGRVRMRVNVESARAAQLTISSNLLRSAQIVPAERGH